MTDMKRRGRASLQGLRVGVDVGGTFTDAILLAGEKLAVAKVPTTPHDPSEGIFQAIEQMLASVGGQWRDITQIVHATTLAVNAITERRGALTALLATEGFRDVLEIGESRRYDRYDLFLTKPPTLVPRYLRLGVAERVGAEGCVRQPLDQEQLRNLIIALRASGVESVAICLLHSYRNRQHEDEIQACLAQELPEVEVSISADVDPNIGEYIRCSTTVCNAYVKPLVKRYLTNLRNGFTERGVEVDPYLMLAHGGLGQWSTGMERPIRLLESGPAAGAVASSWRGMAIDLLDLVSFDMGGTTAKICLLSDGKPSRTDIFEVAREHRFKRGSGLPVRMPTIELLEIGAGGGSIARLNTAGLLKVGPQSAGAVPGPACYGRGGTEPTVTDAHVVLGLIGATSFLGGSMPLDAAAAATAIESNIARPLGISTVEAALGIYEVVNNNMALAIRLHLTERGKDPRHFTLMAFGGAGPVHAYEIARQLKLQHVVVPPSAGVESAFGLLAAAPAAESVRTYWTRLDELPAEEVRNHLVTLANEGINLLEGIGSARDDIAITYSADMRFEGQGHELQVAITLDELTNFDAATIRDRFFHIYETQYRQLPPTDHLSVEIRRLRVRVSVTTDNPLSVREVGLSPAPAARREQSRPVYFPEVGRAVDTPVLHRSALSPGTRRAGPVVVEEAESTTVIGPSASMEIDPLGNLHVYLENRNEQRTPGS